MNIKTSNPQGTTWQSLDDVVQTAATTNSKGNEITKQSKQMSMKQT